MNFIESASFIIAIMLFHALIGKLGAIRALFSEKVHAIPLRELTGIHRRADLVKQFGEHDEDNLFTVKLIGLLSGRRWWRWLFGNVLLEAVLIYLLIGTVFGNHQIGGIVLAIAIPYYALSQFIAIRGFKSARAEIEQEIADNVTRKRQHLQNISG